MSNSQRVVKRTSSRRKEREKSLELVENTEFERTIELKHPITIDSGEGLESIEKIVFPRTIKVKHLRRFPRELWESSENEEVNINPLDFIPFISDLTGVPDEYLEEFEIEDWNNILNKVRRIYPFF